MDFTGMTLKERADYCLNIYREDAEGTLPKCSDNFNDNKQCGYICCGHCPDYNGCGQKCLRVWIDPGLLTSNPKGRLVYMLLETGRLVSGSIPCLISDAYDDNE